MRADSRPATTYARETIGIDPEVLYTLNGFVRSSGISKTRMREARAAGVVLDTLPVGKSRFVKGVAGISYIERLAELEMAQQVAEVQ